MIGYRLMGELRQGCRLGGAVSLVSFSIWSPYFSVSVKPFFPAQQAQIIKDSERKRDAVQREGDDEESA